MRWGIGMVRTRLAAMVACAGVAASAVAAEPVRAGRGASLVFEQVFRADDRGSQHFSATYRSAGAPHQVEVWREGARRLKRITDQSVETLVTRADSGPEYRMTVLDLRRKISTTIDRSSLNRIGNFTEWFGLAHALAHPGGEYRLVRAAAPAGAPSPAQPCTWFALEQGGVASTICWSARSELPMLIVSAAGETVWQVSAVDRRPIAAAVFAIDDRGFARSDANQDIERD
jgi:hypothetical protein